MDVTRTFTTQAEFESADLSDVQHIQLGLEGIVDLGPIARAPRLTRITVDGTRVQTLLPLSGLSQLEELRLYENVALDDLSPLAGCRALKKLVVHPAASGLEVVRSLVELRDLTLFQASRTTTPLHWLGQLCALERLRVDRIRVDPEWLASASSLRVLDLSATTTSDLSALRALPQLRELGTSGNAVVDVAPLAALTHLRRLVLAHNQVEDITPLQGLVQLRHLDLSYNRITVLTPLAALRNLERLALDHNRVRCIAGLCGLEALRDLNLRHNRVEDLAPLQLLNHLRVLNRSGNPAPTQGLREPLASLLLQESRRCASRGES